jgi:hypothetical protein
MKNIRPQYVTMQRITAVHVTPVKIARKGTRWATKNGMELTGEMRPWGRRSSSLPVVVVVSVEMADRPGRAGAEVGSGGDRVWRPGRRSDGVVGLRTLTQLGYRR